MEKFGVHDIYGYKHYASTGTMVYRGKVINNSYDFARYGAFQSSVGAALTVVYDPLLSSQTPITTYGSLMFNHVGDGSFYGDASSTSAMATRILNAVRAQPLPSFLLAGYQRFRQDDFTLRPDPGTSDISIPRLAEVVQVIKADSMLGQLVEVVTPEKFSILMRKNVGLLAVPQHPLRPEHYALLQNYPNPFNPSTNIQYSIVNRQLTIVKVYDVLGREVSTLVNELKQPGTYTVQFDGSRLSSGIYFYRMKAGTFAETKRLLLLR